MTEYQISAKKSVSIPVLQAYDLWAKMAMFYNSSTPSLSTSFFLGCSPNHRRLVDLGCGRNTEKLLRYQNIQRIYGLDGTPGICRAYPRLHLHSYNIVADSPPYDSFLPFEVDAVISTLVIEHLPSLAQFFTLVHKMLRSGGWCLVTVTNMHEDMGARTGAGFVDESGVRVTMDKFVHTVEDVTAAALACGFELQDSPMIRRVKNEEHAKSLSSRAGKWVGINMLYGMVFVKTS
ncbi:hypothetical protein DFH06DRAFT_1354022 [Mycena polygramma]|nr:hypothetical protein DFH06DRAFT_1354022 [Mycena polygramma]